MKSMPYVLTVMIKAENGAWNKVCYRYATPEDMIYYASYFTGLCEERLNDGTIVDYEISY